MNPEQWSAEEAVYDRITVQNSAGSRVLGMVDTDAMAAAAADRYALGITVDDQEVPAIVPVEYAIGYDVRRSREIVDEDGIDKVLYYGLPELFTPTDAQVQQLAGRLATKQYGYIFYDHRTTDRPPTLLTDAIFLSGHEMKKLPLRDEQARQGNEQASISLYGFDLPVENPELSNNDRKLDMEGWYGKYAEGVAAGTYVHDTENGTALLKGDQIDQKTFEAMWSLYQDRFQWLGERHPVSMEDAKGEFEAALRSRETMVSAQFVDGEPVCFTYLTGQIESLYWLNREFINDPDEVGLQEGQSLIFLPGIVAREDTKGYSIPVIGLLANTAFDANLNARVIFENTNRSEEYIPRLVRTIINRVASSRENGLTMRPPEMIDKTVYGCIQFGKKIVAEEVQISAIAA